MTQVVEFGEHIPKSVARITDIFQPRLNCPACGPTNHIAEYRGFLFCVPCNPVMMRAINVERGDPARPS